MGLCGNPVLWVLALLCGQGLQCAGAEQGQVVLDKSMLLGVLQVRQRRHWARSDDKQP